MTDKTTITDEELVRWDYAGGTPGEMEQRTRRLVAEVRRLRTALAQAEKVNDCRMAKGEAE